ncbi:hypothetical protein Y032_0219g2457 [Ancylostoma ceylanicum]|uniref:Uncharacterized protein n=1 Tax=Ancylostoma ceylanicum TaxID=53326 RepID=A0A016SIF4_9BILA|nr:hypothetical protein Y032_0219g2457 [Ancylostoma ceylanicum]
MRAKRASVEVWKSGVSRTTRLNLLGRVTEQEEGFYDINSLTSTTCARLGNEKRRGGGEGHETPDSDGVPVGVVTEKASVASRQKAELLPQLLWKDDEPPPANFTPQLSLYENLIWNSPITSSPNEEADGAELVLKETGETFDVYRQVNAYWIFQDLVYSDGSRSCPASHEHLGLQISSSLVTWSHSRRG